MISTVLSIPLGAGFESNSLSAFLLITLFYMLLSAQLMRLLIRFGMKSGENNGRAKITLPIIAALIGAVPNIVYLILIEIGENAADVSGAIRAYNMLAWSHWPVLSVLFPLISALIGLGDKEWKYYLHALTLGYSVHLLLDFILYRTPSYFLYPVYVKDVQPYGLNLAIQFDSMVGAPALEAILFAAVLIWLIADLYLGRKGRGNGK